VRGCWRSAISASLELNRFPIEPVFQVLPLGSFCEVGGVAAARGPVFVQELGLARGFAGWSRGPVLDSGFGGGRPWSRWSLVRLCRGSGTAMDRPGLRCRTGGGGVSFTDRMGGDDGRRGGRGIPFPAHRPPPAPPPRPLPPPPPPPPSPLCCSPTPLPHPLPPPPSPPPRPTHYHLPPPLPFTPSFPFCDDRPLPLQRPVPTAHPSPPRPHKKKKK